MADPNVGQRVASAFNAVVTKKPIDQIFEDHFLFQYLNSKNGGLVTQDGGKQIEFSLDYLVNPSFRATSDGEVLDTSRVDTIDAAIYDWKTHAGTVVYSEEELAKASGDSAKFDYLAAKIDNGLRSHKEDIALALVGNNTNPKAVNGLQYLIPDTPTSNSPGGISRSTFAFWRTNALSGAKTSTPFDNLRAKMTELYNASSTGMGGKHPTFIPCGLAPYQGYESTLTVNERFQDKKSGDGGFKDGTLRFKGADIGYDSRIDDARLYVLSPDGLKLVVMKGFMLKMGKDIEAINAFIKVRKFGSMLQLCVAEPRLLGVLHSIS